ncbi:MAG TPA: diguanylate cyclase [Burkholderiales bacterium]
MSAATGQAGSMADARPLSYAAQVVLLAAAYFAAAKLAMGTAIPPGYAAPVCPSSGIALAAVLLLGNRVWPGIWLGAVLASVTVKSSMAAALLIGTGSTLEALAAAALVQRYLGNSQRFERGEDVVEFVAIAALCATIASSLAAVTLALVHSLSWSELLVNWWTWWQGDAMGVVIVTPLILSWSLRDDASFRFRRLAEGLCLAVLALGLTYLIFSDGMAGRLPSLPLTFAILPFVLWTALRFGQREVATINALVCAIAAWFTLQGEGPFSGMPTSTSFLLLLAFMSTVVCTGFLLNVVISERSRAIQALGRALQDLKEEAIRDPLTGLYNRRFLKDYLGRELIRAKRNRAFVALIMLDLDHFKRVNDTAGHQVGDRVLAQTATLLKDHIRGSDIVCRYGGEEFVLVLPNTALENARARGEEICSAIRGECNRLNGVTASLGVALYPDHGGSAEALMRAADRALYEAKRAGRDQVRICAHDFAKPRSSRPRAIRERQ